MKTFKHIKTGEIATYKDGILKSSGFTIELGVEPSNKFWQEIIEKPKNYEILSFKRKSNGTITTKRANGLFLNIKQEGDGAYPEERDLDIWDIHSVKRLSDGEIFTVGDKINQEVQLCSNSIIESFNFDVKGNNIIAWVHNTKPEFKVGLQLATIQKVKQPLFKTEDGVDIFEGDNYYRIISNWKTQQENAIGLGEHIYKSDNIERFSTKKAADEYIFNNKPCLSLNDISNIYATAKQRKGNCNYNKQAEKLYQLVKSKI